MDKKALILSFFFSFFAKNHILSKTWNFTNKSGQLITLKSEGDPLLSQEEIILSKAFKHAYTPLTEEELPPRKDLDGFIKGLCDDEKKEFIASIDKEAMVCVRAFKDGKMVGVAIFDRGKEAYLRQLAVDPDYKGLGIGKKLTLSILEIDPDTEKLHLVTRKINAPAIALYERIGFKPSKFEHDGSDPKYYQGYTYVVPGR